MNELECLALLEMVAEYYRGATMKCLANGTWVVVTSDHVYLWSERDYRRYRKGSLQRAIARKLRKEEEVPA